MGFSATTERHLCKVMKECQAYFNLARPHQGIEQRVPCQTQLPNAPPLDGKVVSRPLLDGLHHDYYWQAPGRESLPRAA